eukprot:CAMPEP_0113826660 /NCGR_PEP_ID=MMETSP0328-20130328/4372_1 /TAXON_ID=39455 /ORGANISM="Alexandrium minutum" /LENGTH=157 /DNA_ID=CAMNT_0000794637 /DNA_START=82 /DNA_END=552 /DNA_ORIENTATION=+ /assembly_acc=CAM_ASM_000350
MSASSRAPPTVVPSDLSASGVRADDADVELIGLGLFLLEEFEEEEAATSKVEAAECQLPKTHRPRLVRLQKRLGDDVHPRVGLCDVRERQEEEHCRGLVRSEAHARQDRQRAEGHVGHRKEGDQCEPTLVVPVMAAGGTGSGSEDAVQAFKGIVLDT